MPLTLDGDGNPVLSKRKKRGSLFFKKKKGKDKEKENKKGGGNATSSHHFVSVCYSNSTVCHVCNKSMANKAALRCENCLVNVHEHSCKDQISNCTQFRGPIKQMNMRPTLPQTQSWQLQVPKDRPLLITPIKATPSGPLASPSPVGRENKKQNGGTPPKQTPTSSPSPNIPSVSSPSKVISEEREADGEDGLLNKFGSIIDINSASMESLDEGAAELAIMDDDPELRLPEEEPEAWSSTVDKKVLKKLKEKDIKRQEIIYELIITEKHHCLTLKVMQKLFAQGMNKELGMTAEMVDKIFPKLEDIIEVHVTFLKRLQERQKKEPIIESISDILLQQFQGEMASMMKDAYGAFCSRHKEALSLYKDIFKQDRKFQTFIKNRIALPLCKARGIPECILLVTQRITKYPLLIESLIKAYKDNKVEQQNLTQVNNLVKDILSNVNLQVAEKEKEQRLLQIYNKIDAKSATIYKGKKFKKSDLLSNNRRLRHEAAVGLRQARGKEIEVTVVVLSDVIFFLQENNQKYSFVTHDNKAGVISLQKLLVREKAGQDNRGIYLISSHPNDPEMYELVFSSPKEKKAWMEGIRKAVDLCPEEDEGVPSETEEERKVMEAKSARLRELTTNLHEKDKELAVICEEKMRILGEMMEVVGKEEVMEPVQYLQLMEDPHESSDARDMLLAAVQEASRLASTLYVSGTNLSRSISSAGEHQSDAYISPILPKRAETFGGFDNPNKDVLPKPVIIKKKHLDTARESDSWVTGLGGLLNKNDQHTSSASDLDSKETDTLLSVKSKEVRRASGPLPYRESLSPNSPEKSVMRRSTLSAGFLPLPLKSEDYNLGSTGSIEGDKDSSREMLNLPTPPLVTIGREQWTNTIQLSHYLNTLMCVFSQHFTSVEILKAELTKAYEEISKLSKECGREARDKKSLYRPNQQLEELRNLQEQLTQERTLWQKERDAQERILEEKREELTRLQESLRNEKEDVNQQREFLYRQLEALQRKGIILSPTLSVVSTHGGGAEGASSADKSTPCPTEAPTSPGTHRRSMSCDLQLPNKEPANRGGTCSATSSPTQTLETAKPKADLKPRSSASNLASLLPLNLYSATNQQKASQGLAVKQQLPLKLASGGSLGAGGKHGVGSVAANASGLAHVLNTSPHLRGHRDGNSVTAAARTLAHSASGSLASPPGPQPQSYLHGHASQWSHPTTAHPRAVEGDVAGRPPPSADGNSKNRDRHRRPRDPDASEEIIYF